MDVEEGGSEWVKNTLSVFGICAVGAAGWAIAWKTGVWVPQPTHNDAAGSDTPLGASILGYASAVCYLGARIPQIIKNQRERSCEGLSLLFFMLSLLGNATYGAGVSPSSFDARHSMLTKDRSSFTPKKNPTSSQISPGSLVPSAQWLKT
jgi:hypothetical protein